MYSIATVLNQHTKLLIETNRLLSEQCKARAEDRAYMASQAATISTLKNTVATLDSNLAKANQKLAMLRTPPSTATTAGSRRSFQDIVVDDDIARPVDSMPPRKLQYGAEAKAVAESGSNSNMFISTVLVDLYKKGCLKAKAWKNIEVPSKYTEKQSLKKTLEL